MIKEIFKDFPILSTISSIGLLLISIYVADVFTIKTEVFYGTVIDKHYNPASESLGIGTAITSNGTIGTLTAYNSESEKHLITVKTKNEKIVTVQCEPQLYYQKKIGDTIECNSHIGTLIGIVWSLHGVK